MEKALVTGASRGIGEAAPLIVAGAVGMILSTPNSLFSQYTVLPIQIYDWTGRPQAAAPTSSVTKRAQAPESRALVCMKPPRAPLHGRKRRFDLAKKTAPVQSSSG